MHRKEHEFYRRLSNAFSNISVKLDRSIIIERTFLNAGDYDSLVYELKSRRQSYDGLAILSQMNKDVEFAVEEAVNSGVPVVTLISDLPGSRRSAFIGINNRAAGRAAAHLLSMMTGIDQVYAICTNRSFFDQSERIAGFEEGLKMYACNCKFAVVSEDMIKMEMFRVRSDNDNNIGIYFSGHLNRTATDFLEQNDRINVIAHELTPSNVRYLQNGSLAFVIDQNPEEQARRIIDHMLFHSGVIDMPPSADHVPFSLHGRENAVIPGRGLI